VGKSKWGEYRFQIRRLRRLLLEESMRVIGLVSDLLSVRGYFWR
jgi:hypothetical protein